MTVVVFCEKDGVTCKGKLIPLWDAWNNCVEEDYTREQTFNFRNTTPSSYASLDLGVTDKCFGEHSQMHWRTARDDGAHADVELHVDSFTGTVHAECGGLLRGTCKKHDKSATQLMVVFSS